MHCCSLQLRSACRECYIPVCVPPTGKLVELELAAIEDRRIRGQLRNVTDLEIKITAMQVAALKRLSKGSPLYIMDRNGSTAKAVARELAARGFSKAFVVSGGFGGWVSAKLGVRASNTVSRVEVLSPGSFLGGTTGSRATGTRRGTRALPPQAPRRALPSTTGQ
jgi:rhodanese-related sulfurtransferase